ncbi:hypothetical protein [Streptomyces sp. NPDC127114]|uniref:hypothetical protein n=1 Tax=Streptomyces sp. NPDC127114 TaxID=3345366 RepID=UPI0036336705
MALRTSPIQLTLKTGVVSGAHRVDDARDSAANAAMRRSGRRHVAGTMDAAQTRRGPLMSYLREHAAASTQQTPATPGTMDLMEPLPIPCPAGRIPDASGSGGFQAAYRAAQEQRAVFVVLEREGPRWRIKADTLTAPELTVDPSVYEALRDAIVRLIDDREIRPDSYAGPVYFVLHDVGSESRARELAAALHAALYGDLEPLALAVPSRS